MAKKKRKKSKGRKSRGSTSVPREKRLIAGAAWVDGRVPDEIPKFVRKYRNKFNVDTLCAIVELRMLGIEISAEYEQRVRESIEAEAKRRKEKKTKESEIDMYENGDETFAFIAGYTSGGFPYGTTWDELRQSQLDPEDPHKEYRESFDAPEGFWDLDNCDGFTF